MIMIVFGVLLFTAAVIIAMYILVDSKNGRSVCIITTLFAICASLLITTGMHELHTELKVLQTQCPAEEKSE